MIYLYGIVLLALALCIAFARPLATYLRQLYLSRQFPGPTPLPLIGNALLFLNLQPEDFRFVVKSLSDTYGETVRVWIGTEFCVYMTGVKDMEVVLASPVLIDKSQEYDMLRPWLNDGLLLSTGQKWFKRRRVLTPAFHFKILEKFVHVFDRESRILLRNLATDSERSNTIDISHWIGMLTLDIICDGDLIFKTFAVTCERFAPNEIFSDWKMLFIFGLLAATAASWAFILYKFKFERIIRITRDIPGAPTWPIIGHGHYFARKSPCQILRTFKQFEQEYGTIFKVWLGTDLHIIISDVRDVEVVLGSRRFNDKAGEYKKLESWLREGLLVSRGSKWQKRRKIITPAFHFNILEQFVGVFEKESRRLINNLKAVHCEEMFDFYEWINLCTLDTICGNHIQVLVLKFFFI